MRQWLRSNLTYANVMATLAVFLVLGGGTALGAYVVSSNSQIGPNTVSGHKPPSGKHANIIAGSINGQDVQHLKFQPLTLKNGWVGNCIGGGVPAIAKSVEGVVYFRGEMCLPSGSLANAFDVPAGYIPSRGQVMPVAQGSNATGRILVHAIDGEVDVSSDPDHPTATATLVSLSGVSY